MMPRCFAQVGEPQIIKRIGGNPETRKHLEDLGFHIGGEISVINTIGGNLIVNVKECRVAVSRELANKIMI
jgi:ferrous iron transport protein A